MSYVLGSKKWEDNFNTLLHLVKEFTKGEGDCSHMISTKQKLYADDLYPVQLRVSPRPEVGVLLLELGVGLVKVR